MEFQSFHMKTEKEVINSVFNNHVRKDIIKDTVD
jgi:hypothetical protein